MCKAPCFPPQHLLSSSAHQSQWIAWHRPENRLVRLSRDDPRSLLHLLSTKPLKCNPHDTCPTLTHNSSFICRDRFLPCSYYFHHHFLPYFKELRFASDVSVKIMNVINEVLDQVSKIKLKKPTRQDCEWTWQRIKSSRVPTLPIFIEGRQNTNLCIPL